MCDCQMEYQKAFHRAVSEIQLPQYSSVVKHLVVDQNRVEIGQAENFQETLIHILQ